MTVQAYRTVDVAVDGGDLHVGIWEPTGVAPVADVLLIHGITASHQAFVELAAALPSARLIAPDLRGRGRSADVAGGAGMARHADDIAAVLDALDAPRATVVGHSMGGFVAMVLAHRHPERVDRTVLVDGGVPLDVPAGVDPEALTSAILGPTAARLSMTFASPEAYLDFWRPHPAFAGAWTPALEQYFRYDLVRDGDAWRAAASLEVTVADTEDMVMGTALRDALAQVGSPLRLVTAPRGLLDDEPGLYAPAYLERALAGLPGLVHERAGDCNHYTIVMAPAGARMVASIVAEEIDAARRGAHA